MQHAQFASIWFVYWQHSGQYSLARLMLRVATRRYASCATPQPPLSCPALPYLPVVHNSHIHWHSHSNSLSHFHFHFDWHWPLHLTERTRTTWSRSRRRTSSCETERSEANQNQTKPNWGEVRAENRIEAMTAMQFYSCRLNGWRHMDAKQ